jgi:hypothetical protein
VVLIVRDGELRQRSADRERNIRRFGIGKTAALMEQGQHE